MNELQRAIEEITYKSSRLPEKAFRIIEKNREEAIPYLRASVEYAFAKRNEMEEGYQLHFYALFLLAQFQDREFFPKIIEFVSMPEDELDYLIGDCITSGLRDILYNTYNGDLELLKKTARDDTVGEFVQSEVLDVMCQLYLDGVIKESEWKSFLKQSVHDAQEYSYFYNAAACLICRCHFADMLPEIRYLLDHGLMDEGVMGKYDSCVDRMFDYREDRQLCESPVNAANTLRHWAMFEDNSESEVSEKSKKDFEKMLRAMKRESHQPAVMKKIGRNDPCPCGSGKKYKFCCLNKPKDALDAVESPNERQKWLKNYPYTGKERIKGRIYLEDFYDPLSIEIDKILYLGLMNRPGLIWERDEKAEEQRAKKYLYLAYQKCSERMEREQISLLTVYDEKYSIHYFCEEWIPELLRLLQNDHEKEIYREVGKWYKAYSAK